MTTVFIETTAVNLPSRFAAGDIIGEVAANVLNDIQIKRIRVRLAYMLKKGDINPDGLQARANELASQDLAPHVTLDDEDENSDPILAEALLIAKELITRRMAAEGLPVPKGIDIHAKALVDALPELQEKARLRVEARFRAANSAMEGAI